MCLKEGTLSLLTCKNIVNDSRAGTSRAHSSFLIGKAVSARGTVFALLFMEETFFGKVFVCFVEVLWPSQQYYSHIEPPPKGRRKES